MLAIAVSALAALQWQQVGYPINGSVAKEHFGYSATLSNNGSVLAIGRSGGTDSAPKIYMQQNTSGSPTWNELTVEEPTITILGGPRSVHFSTDAEFLAVGYPRADSNKGTAYLYKRAGQNYQILGFTNYGADIYDNKGDKVVMFKNTSGTVGVLESELAGDSDNSGDVNRYTLDSNENIQGPASIKPQDGTTIVDSGDEFGVSMDASDDGNTVVVGTSVGKIFFFSRTINGDWAHVAPLAVRTSSDITSVSMSSNGQRAAIGIYEDNGVEIWDFTSQNWEKSATIMAPNPGGSFGWSVSLSGDGKRLAVGAPGPSSSFGRVHIFHEQSPGNWVQLGQPIDGDSAEQMGFRVTMSGDGSTVAVSAPEYNNGGNTYAGRVKIYKAVIDDDNDDDDEGLGTGAIVGIAIGATAGAAAIGATAYYAVPFFFTGGKYAPVEQPFL